jgi:hypothetical protein
MIGGIEEVGEVMWKVEGISIHIIVALAVVP